MLAYLDLSFAKLSVAKGISSNTIMYHGLCSSLLCYRLWIETGWTCW